MATRSVFNFLTLNGFYKGPDGDISWHRHGGEENRYSVEALQSDNILVFGRITYQMMASYWPRPDALKNNPQVAAGMNRAEKLVFSKTLEHADWQNTRLLRGNLVEEIRKMKEDTSKNLTVLGSGRIVTQLAEHNLIDSYQLLIDPVAIGNGTPIFSGLQHHLHLELTGSKIFKSGVVLLSYQPVAV